MISCPRSLWQRVAIVVVGLSCWACHDEHRPDDEAPDAATPAAARDAASSRTDASSPAVCMRVEGAYSLRPFGPGCDRFGVGDGVVAEITQVRCDAELVLRNARTGARTEPVLGTVVDTTPTSARVEVRTSRGNTWQLVMTRSLGGLSAEASVRSDAGETCRMIQRP